MQYIFKGGSDGNIFKIGSYSHWGTYSCRGMAIVWWPEWPANPNSDWIQHVLFLTLNFIIDFVTYELNINILCCIPFVFHHSSLWTLLCMRFISCVVRSCDKWMFYWKHEYWQSFTPSGLQYHMHSSWSIRLRSMRDMDYTLHMEVWCMYIGRDGNILKVGIPIEGLFHIFSGHTR